MRTLRFLLRKEFRQIFRDKSIVAMIFFMPMVQLILMPLAADYEVRNINLSVVDHDKSPYSQKLISKIVASGYFRLTGYNASFKEAFGLIESDKADLILEIPHGFERNLIREDHEKLFVAVNAINGTKASLGGSYLGSIIGDFNADIRMQLVTPPRAQPVLPQLDHVHRPSVTAAPGRRRPGSRPCPAGFGPFRRRVRTCGGPAPRRARPTSAGEARCPRPAGREARRRGSRRPGPGRCRAGRTGRPLRAPPGSAR